ncbi:MAG: hypothetical protein IJ506_00400 [Clostridia bacterium]|nr:hypothetical protein [Clostridia bacterium]
MNKKFVNRTIGKPLLLSVIVAVIVIAGIVVGAIFGFNKAATVDDMKLLTVNMDSFVYETELEKVEEICEEAFEDVSYKYSQKGVMSGADQEISYAFDKEENLDTVKKALADELQKAFPDFEIRVTVTTETVEKSLPTSYIVRAAIAGAIFCVLAFAYTAIRHNLATGSAISLAMWLSGALTFAVFTLTRIPVTTAFTYVLFFNLIVTAIAASFTFRKVDETLKTEAGKAMSVDELTQSSVATKEILIFVVATAIALVLVGAIATHTMRMFAISSLVALVVSTFSAWLFAPAVFAPLKKVSDKNAAKRARYDYKKDKKTSEEA